MCDFFEELIHFVWGIVFGEEDSELFKFVFVISAILFFFGMIPADKLEDQYIVERNPFIVQIDGKLYRLEPLKKGPYKDKNASSY